MNTRSTTTRYRAIRGRFLLEAAACSWLSVQLIVGAQSALAQATSIDSGASAVSLNGRVGERFTFTCAAISAARNSIYGTDIYTADSPICQAALHAGVLRPGQAGTVTIEINAGVKEYAGSTRNGITTRSYGPYPTSYTFVGGIDAPPRVATTPPADISAPPGPPINTSGNDMPATTPTVAAASNNTPVPPAAGNNPPPSSGAHLEDPAAWNSLAKKALAAVAQSVDTWKLQARLKGQVNGAMLLISPGGLTGPALGPLIKSNLVGQGVVPETADKFANVFGNAWQQWQAGFALSGFAAYPALGAWPAAQAPPTPNVRFLLTVGSPGALLSASVLRSMLLAQFPGATPQQVQAIEAFATAAANNFTIWRGSTQVTNLMGSGPVPSYRPPAVPVGPVVGGTATMLPGGLIGPGFPTIGIP